MKELGIEPMLLLAQIINFGIIFFVLKKFLYKPVLTMLEKRKKETEMAIDRAKKMEHEEEKMKEKQEKQVSEAKKEARLIIEEAKKQAEEQKRQTLTEAHTEVQTLLAKGKTQAAAYQKTIEADMRKQAVELAALMVEKLLPSILSDQDHKKLIASQLNDLEKSVKTVN
jgi:F-type H+-transporting ATPase subunit b